MQRAAGRAVIALVLLTTAACDGDGDADGGPPPMDAGAEDAGGPSDAGVDAAGPMCREDIRAPFTTRPCNQDTADCAAACADAACAENCFLMDPSSQCIACWDANQLACWNRNGCQDEWNCIAQCITDSCPTATPECIGANCEAEDLAYADCFEMVRPMCLERTIDCLPG